MLVFHNLFPIVFAVFGEQDVLFFSSLILLAFLLIVAAFFGGAWIRKNTIAVSPYTGSPLRKAENLPYFSAKQILQFVFNKHEYDNRLFELKNASICRDTGRIFQDSVTWYDTVNVDWNFLQKRFPGNYVSWGSLSDHQKKALQEVHDTFEGYQTEFSSPQPSPRAVEPEYVFKKPGPLYVDMDTKVLLGWQVVPGTEFEVLVIQRPKKK